MNFIVQTKKSKGLVALILKVAHLTEEEILREISFPIQRELAIGRVCSIRGDAVCFTKALKD